MRLRRGNYAILFVVTAAVLMSYLAFSIDGGRMKVAYIQTENAAEAAALAAMVVIRDGGSQNDATQAAERAAEAVRLQRIERTVQADRPFDVRIDWGQWNWTEQGTSDNLGFRWHPENAQDMQAVTVNVGVNGGVASVFGPAIGLVSHNGGQFDDPYAHLKYEKFDVQVGARAAFRNRDTMVIVDVSRDNEANLDPHTGALRPALAQFVDTMNGFHVPGDRIALMAYAGNAWVYDLVDTTQGVVDPAEMSGDGFNGSEASVQPFYDLKANAATARDVMEGVEPCYEGADAWFYWYRYMDLGQDPELAGYNNGSSLSLPYRVVGSATGVGTNDLNTFRLNPNDHANDFMLQVMNLWATVNVPSCTRTYENSQICPYFSNLYGTQLSKFDQCMAWLAAETVYDLFDPRRQEMLNGTGRRSPLTCHDGNFFEGRSDSVEVGSSHVALGQNCGFAGDSGFTGPDGQPTPRYGRNDDELLYPDHTYTQAGSRPGRALTRALQFFQNRSTKSSEANIVLITATAPDCGPNIGDTYGQVCLNQFTDEAFDAVRAIQAAGNVNLYVVGITQPGSYDEQILRNWGEVGRGWYATVPADQVSGELTSIARDMKIQVVQ